MARIQKLESDSSFQLSQILENTVLTYKTYQNGRIIHKAKLANGNVVEINPLPDLSDYYTKAQIDAFISKSLNYKEASQSLTALDRDFLICTDPLTVTLPQVQQGSLIGISSTDTSNYVQILAYAGQGIYRDASNSYQQGMSIGGNCASVLLYGTEDRWLVADIAANPKGLDNIADQLQNYYDKNQIDQILSDSYYTKDEVDSIVSDLASDSLITSLQERVSTIQNTPVVHSIESVGSIDIQSNSGYITLNIRQLSDSQTLKYLNLTSSGLGIKGIDEVLIQMGNYIGLLSDSLQGIKESLSNSYYTRNEIDQLFQQFSNSLSLNNYYTKSQINEFISTISDSIGQLKTLVPYSIQFSQVSNNIYTIDSKVTVIGVFTNQGQYYPAQKFSVQYSGSSTLLNVSAYLAYSNQGSFTGTWKALVVPI